MRVARIAAYKCRHTLRARCCAHSIAAGARRDADLTVAVGISGGVDSAVAAHLLVEQGYRVIGLHVRSWDERDETGQCSGEADRRDAQMVCDKLGIPLHDVRPPPTSPPSPESAAINRVSHLRNARVVFACGHS